jgi:hypothetical protein
LQGWRENQRNRKTSVAPDLIEFLSHQSADSVVEESLEDDHPIP